jgi:hypothetical protein
MARKKSSGRSRHRVVRVPSGNVGSAVTLNVAEGVPSRDGITISLNDEPKQPRQRKRTGTV